MKEKKYLVLQLPKTEFAYYQTIQWFDSFDKAFDTLCEIAEEHRCTAIKRPAREAAIHVEMPDHLLQLWIAETPSLN